MSITIMWLGQGGYLLKTDKGSLSIDPFCTDAKGICERMYPNFIDKGSVSVDLVLSTHDHWDHFDAETYRDYVIPKTFVGPGSCMKLYKESGLPFEAVELNRGEVLERAGFRITATVADHTADSVGYFVETEGLKLYFTGDTLYTAKLLEGNAELRPDVIFTCINGKLGNMGYHEAARYARFLGVKVAVPNHYDMIRHNTENPQEFVNALAQVAPEIPSVVLESKVEYPMEYIIKK